VVSCYCKLFMSCIDAGCCYVAWSVCLSVCLSVSLCQSVRVLVTTVSPVKPAEPIEMSFGDRLAWAQGVMYYMGYISAPPDEYD